MTEEECNDFCKSISKDYLDLLAFSHLNAEGETELKTILFMPKKSPHDMLGQFLDEAF